MVLKVGPPAEYKTAPSGNRQGLTYNVQMFGDRPGLMGRLGIVVMEGSSMFKRILLSVFFVVLSIGVCQAESTDYLEARKAYRQGKYELAREKIMPLAKAGDPRAQYAIGLMYRNGRGFFKDKDEADKWFLKAEKGLQKLAKDKDPEALTMLGYMFYRGAGIEKDYEQAAENFKKAANSGYKLAQFYLGWLYRSGHGVPWDEKKAIKWYEKAAKQGMSLAANNIGVLYHNGETIEKDPIKALMWYSIAKTIGDKSIVLDRRGRKLAKRNAAKRTFTEEMFPSETEKANRLAREWLKENGYHP